MHNFIYIWNGIWEYLSIHLNAEPKGIWGFRITMHWRLILVKSNCSNTCIIWTKITNWYLGHGDIDRWKWDYVNHMRNLDTIHQTPEKQRRTKWPMYFSNFHSGMSLFPFAPPLNVSDHKHVVTLQTTKLCNKPVSQPPGLQWNREVFKTSQ